MSFTPKLEVHLKKVVPQENNIAPIVKLIAAIVVIVLALQGLFSLFINPISTTWHIFCNMIIAIIVGTFVTYAFNYVHNKLEQDKIKMTSGKYEFNNVINWTNLTMQTHIMRAVIQFKAMEAFKQSQSYVNVEFNNTHGTITLQTPLHLTTNDINNKLKQCFGTESIFISHKEYSNYHMYEIEILLANVQWIEGQDIVDYHRQVE